MLFLCISNTSYISALDNDEIPTIKRLLEVPEIEEKGPEFVIGKKKRCKPRGEGDATSSKNVTKRKCEKKCGKDAQCSAFEYFVKNDAVTKCTLFSHRTVRLKKSRNKSVLCAVKIRSTPIPSDAPSAVPSAKPSASSSSAPSKRPSRLPSAPPSSSPSATPSDGPSDPPSAPPSAVPSEAPSPAPSAAPSATPGPRAAWMSGKHGVGYRVPGGAHYGTVNFDAAQIAAQIADTPVSHFIFGLSSGAAGDRYLSPHPVFTELGMKAATPKDVDTNVWTSWNPDSVNVDLAALDDIDVFDAFLTAMDRIGVKVIAYLSAQGPAMLNHGEGHAFDHPDSQVGFLTGGFFVDSSPEACQSLAGVDKCSPSVRKWVRWVAQEYGIDPYNFDDAYVEGSALNLALKEAYADVVIDHYAEKFGRRLAGWWFDSGRYGHRAKILAAIRKHNPDAAVAYNQGVKIPLRNNNGPDEDFTFGHMTAHKGGLNPPDGCYNYGMVLSAESSLDGYVYAGVTPSADYSNEQTASNPYVAPGFQIGYVPDARPSLAHVYLPAQELWNSGELVWNDRQAAEWMHRILRAKGAFTWAVRRMGCGGCSWENQSLINPPDFEFLKRVYTLLPTIEEYQFNATNCDCLSELGTSGNLSWGCGYEPPEDQCKNDDAWSFIFSGRPKACGWVCKAPASSAASRCRTDYANGDGKNAIEACPYCCKTSCPGYS